MYRNKQTGFLEAPTVHLLASSLVSDPELIPPDFHSRFRIISPKPEALKDEQSLKNYFLSTRVPIERIILGQEPLNQSLMKLAPHLKLVSKYGVGLNNLDTKSMETRHLKLGYSPGVNASSVALVALGLMLDVTRKLSESSRLMKNGVWKRPTGTRDLSSLTVGILGFGHIGQALARSLAPIGARVIAHDLRQKTGSRLIPPVCFCNLETLLKESDILSVHIPYHRLNHHFIGSKELKSMRKGIVLINTSRGGILDEGALLKSLQSEQVSHYASDVFEREPKPRRDLVRHPSVTATPHLSASSLEARRAMADAAFKNLTCAKSISHWRRALPPRSLS